MLFVVQLVLRAYLLGSLSEWETNWASMTSLPRDLSSSHDIGSLGILHVCIVLRTGKLSILSIGLASLLQDHTEGEGLLQLGFLVVHFILGLQPDKGQLRTAYSYSRCSELSMQVLDSSSNYPPTH